MAGNNPADGMTAKITHAVRLSQYLNSLLKDRIDRHSQWGELTQQALQELYVTLTALQSELDPIERERANSSALIETAALLNSSLELDFVLNEVMDTIIRLSGSQRGYLMLKDPDNLEMAIRVARNLDRKTVESHEFEISRSVIRKVEETGESILTTNAQEDSRFNMQDSIVAYNLLSILCVPLKYRGIITGIIYTDNKIHAGLFTPQTKELLSAFANQAAIAIENAKLFKNLRETLADIQEMKSLLDNVFASIASGVLTIDTDDHIELVNQSAARILETPPRKLATHDLYSALPQLGSKIRPHLERSKSSHETLAGIDLELGMKSGESASIKLSVSPLLDEYEERRGSVVVLEDVTDIKRREKQIAGVKHYLPAEMIEGIELPESLNLGGTRTEISILFADIRGFSTFSENLDPELLVEIVNRYMTIAADAIHNESGIIDKFMGDAVLALYNTPLRKQPDHIRRAVKSALKMRAAINSYNELVESEWRLHFGIGIHSGEAIVGNIGCPERLEYTAMGDSVNIAKRLQETAQADQILISEPIFHYLASEISATPLGSLSLKGRERKIAVYELIDLT